MQLGASSPMYSITCSEHTGEADHPPHELTLTGRRDHSLMVSP